MYTKIFLILAAILSTSCSTSINELSPPNKSQKVILDKDYFTQTESSFIGKGVTGLLKGEYILVGSDESGEYYLGTKPSIILLFGSDADSYLNTGELTQKIINKNQYPRALNNGGFIVKKSNGNIELEMFYINEPITDGYEHGVVVGAIITSGRGSIQRWGGFIMPPEVKNIISPQLN